MNDRPAILDLRRLAAMSAAATLAVAQPLFTLVLENPQEFPIGGLFHLWVLGWAWLLPLAGLMAVDALLERARPRLLPAWTAALCAGTAVSMLRQAFVYNWRRVDLWGLSGLFPIAAIAAAALAFGLAFRHPAATRRYLAALGVLGVLLAGRYAVGTGLWGPAWASAEAAPAAAAAPTPAFLVVFDELSMDALLEGERIDPVRFPHFAAFAAENAWYARATSNHMYTAKALPCMLTGRTAPGPATPSLFHFLRGRYVPTLVGGWPHLVHWMRRGAKDALKVELQGTLEETGRDPLEAGRILAECAWNAMCLRAHAPGEDGTAVLVGPSGASALRQPELIAQTLARRAGPGLFVYWHSPIPHAPFVYGADGKLHGRPSYAFFPDADPREVFDNYLDQVGLADALFGRFVAALREAKLYERAVIVVTSDHGLRTAALQPPGYPAVMNDLAPRVPLLLKGPGVRPGRHDDDYQHMDLTPTFLDLLGVPFDPGAFEGTSLLAAERPARPKVHTKGRVDYVYDPASGLWRARAK